MPLGVYRTKTYLAADWTGDKEAVEQLYKWNDSDYWSLHFVDVHECTQSSDNSLNCSIKASLKSRMDISKIFILIVGEKTKDVRSGSCSFCQRYNSWTGHCSHGYSVDKRSFIDFECDKAVEAGIKIVVLYFSTKVDRSKCPEALRYIGKHVPMCYYKNGEYYWDYQSIKDAISTS